MIANRIGVDPLAVAHQQLDQMMVEMQEQIDDHWATGWATGWAADWDADAGVRRPAGDLPGVARQRLQRHQ